MSRDKIRKVWALNVDFASQIFRWKNSSSERRLKSPENLFEIAILTMGIDEVFLTMIPSMGIEIFDQKNSFDLAMFKISTKLSPFKFFSLFKLCFGFRGCPNILFGNEVIHSYLYYLSL